MSGFYALRLPRRLGRQPSSGRRRQAQALAYDPENRLAGITQGDTVVAITYDGDGNRIKTVITDTGGVTTTVHISGYYEWSAGSERKYYHHNGQRVAMRDGSGLYWLLADHLGSTAVVATSSGAWAGELRYTAWGETRESSGALPTDYRFTGQRWQDRIGLYDYQARWYDPSLGRFLQPDSLVQHHPKNSSACLTLSVSYAQRLTLERWNELPRAGLGSSEQSPWLGAPLDPQLLNRYTQARNNSLAYTDDSGNWVWCVVGGVAGGLVGLGAYALTHRDNFRWGEALLWTGGGALVGATLGAAGEAVAGALAAKAAGTAATVGTATAGAGAAATSPTVQGLSQRLVQYPVLAYTHLTNLTAGTGLEAHHIIEERFASALGLDARWILSVALTRGEHQLFINAWRAAIPYGTSENVTAQQVWQAAQWIYARHPELLDAVYKMLFQQ